MVTHRRISIAATCLSLALTLGACSKPAPVPAPSDTPALLEPASASDAGPSAPSSIQTTDATAAASSSGGCHQVQVGGGYQPGINGAPGTMTPGQTMTVCSAPTPAQPVPHAAAPPAAAPAPDTD